MIQKMNKRLQGQLKVGVIILAIILFLGLSLIISFHLVFWQKIYPGIKVAEINLGGKTPEQASKILQQVSLKQKKSLKLSTETKQGLAWEISLDNLGFIYLPTETGKKAFLIGRLGNLKKDFEQKIEGLQKGINLDLDYQINRANLKTSIASIAAQIDIPAIPPSIQVIKDEAGSRVEIQTGQPGKELEQEELIKTIYSKLGQVEEPNIALPIKSLLPYISQHQVETTKARAGRLLGKTLTIGYQENSWSLDEAELINFLDFSPGFNEEKIASFAAQLAQSVDRPPQNALFNFSGGRVTEFKPAKFGQALDQEQTLLAIDSALRVLEEKSTESKHSGGSSSGREKETAAITLTVHLAKPAIGNEDVNNLGIKELLGRGDSWFSGSIASRIHNVQLASSLINGLLIAPGETFSLTQALGDISSQTGFKQAWIIKEGRTVLGDGGGVCQVSTTLFRAALKAGLPIVERRAHAYRVSYYEENYQVGVDATVFSPSPDLKFKNDTPGHILIQTYTDTTNLKANYYLYGTSDGRKATISQSRIWDQAPPPPDLYQDDPTLPIGTVKQIDWAAWGAKTAFDWKVVRASEVLQERTFYSSYNPWQAIFLKGTGG